MCGSLAGELFAIQVVPSVQILDLKPGEKAEGQYQLLNTEGRDMTLFPHAVDWFVLNGNENYLAEKWLTFEKEKIPFKSGETVVVRFKVYVPKGAKGELAGGASFTMDEGIETNLVKKMTSVVYVAIKGTEKFKVNLVAFQVTPSTVSLQAGVILENLGNVHVRPYGWINISDVKGKPWANIEIHRNNPLFPGRKEPFYGSVPPFNLPVGEYLVKISISDADRGKDLAQGEKRFRMTKDRKVELITK